MTEANDTSLQQSVGTRAFRGGLWQAAAQIAPLAFTLVISVVAARILGPDDMGRQSYIAFIVVVVQGLLAGGLSAAMLRFSGDLVGRGRERSLRSLERSTLPITIVASGVGAVILLVVAALGASPPWAWVFAAVAVAAGVLSAVSGNILLGAQQWRTYTYVTLATGAASVAATLVALELGGGISGMLAVIAATTAVRFLWLELAARRMFASHGRVEEPIAELRSEVITFSLAMTLPVVLNIVVNQRSEFFFMERYSSDHQIALYSIAFSATAALIAVPKAIGAVLTPSVAALIGSGESGRIQSGFSRLIRLSLLFGLPITAAGFALGPQLLRLLYGQQYAGTADVLLIILLTVPLAPIGGASVALLVGYGRVRSPLVVSAIAAATDIVLAVLLVKRFDAVGAAIANTSASIVATVLLLVAAVRILGRITLGWSSILRIAAISTLAALAARLVFLAGGGVGIFLLACLVLLVMLAAGAMLVRAVPQGDASFLIRVVGRRGRFARVLDRLSERPPPAAV